MYIRGFPSVAFTLCAVLPALTFPEFLDLSALPHRKFPRTRSEHTPRTEKEKKKRQLKEIQHQLIMTCQRK